MGLKNVIVCSLDNFEGDDNISWSFPSNETRSVVHWMIEGDFICSGANRAENECLSYWEIEVDENVDEESNIEWRGL